MDNKNAKDRKTKLIRLIARVWGTITAAFWIISLTLSTIFEKTEELTPTAWIEGLILGILVFISSVGVTIAWWCEGIGGLIVVIGGIVLSIFAYITAGHNKVLAMASSGIPFLIAGILFLIYWRRTRKLKS